MLAQNINRPLDQEVAARHAIGGLDFPFVGSVDTAVLRFAQAAVITGPSAFITATNSATLGTQVAILKSGVYSVKLYLRSITPIDLVYGISQDVAVGGLTLPPSFAIAGFVDVQHSADGTVGMTWSLEIETAIIVSPEQEGGTGSIVRFHGTGPSDLALAACYYTVERTNQAHV